jgi:sec-independent protein translocase protein TatC
MTKMSLLDHLEELRSRLVKAVTAIVLASIVAFIFRNWIFDVLTKPWNDVAEGRDLVFFRPTEAFSLFMRISLFGGLIIASPVVLWQAWAFVAPALTKRERKYIIPGSLVLGVLFTSGVLLGYWSLGRGLGFLIDFGQDRLDPTVGGGFYLSFAMRFIIVFGIAFQFPVFLFGLLAAGAVSRQRLESSRRWAVLVIVTVAAVVTPSGDPYTLLLLSVPLYLLYEATLLAARLLLKR